MDAVLQPMFNNVHANPQRGPRVASSTGARNLERGRGSLSLTAADDSGVVGERRAADGVSFVVEFPGGPSCPPPRPPRRTGAVAEAAAQRNVGTMASLLDADANRDYQSPRPLSKLRTAAAKDNAARYRGSETAFCLNHDRNRGYWSGRGPCVKGDVAREARERNRGVLGSVLAGDAHDEPPRPASRLTSAEARSYAQRDRGAHVRRALDVDGNAGYETGRPLSRAVTAEAREYAARGDGRAVSGLMRNADAETTPPPEPRVKPEARYAAARNRGTCGLALEGQPASDPVRDVRVKGSEGKDNYERGRQGSMNHLLSGNGHLPTSECPASRVRDKGAEFLENSQTGTVHKLFNSYGQLPQSPRPASRVRPEAKQNAIRNMGTMSDFM